MRDMNRLEIAPIVIHQNAREEFHLTLMQNHSGKFVDLRTCTRDEIRGNPSPSGEGITVDLELWPQFVAAVSSPKTWTEPLPFWGWQKTRDLGKGRLIFPQEVLQKKPHEQIILENKNFQGIPFIFLKSLERSTRGLVRSVVTIGPLLWSQFMQALRKLEETLLDLGWLAAENDKIKAGHKLPVSEKPFFNGPPAVVSLNSNC